MFHSCPSFGVRRIAPLLMASTVLVAACGSDAAAPESVPTTLPAGDADIGDQVTDPNEPSDTIRSTEPSLPEPTPSDPAGTPTVPVASSVAASADTSPTQPDPDPVVLTPTQQSLADVAIADLVARRDVDPTDVGVVEVEEVTWPDASLGCPQRDMQYQQVLTPGIRVIIEAQGQRAFYHGTSTRDLAYCPAPQPPLDA